MDTIHGGPCSGSARPKNAPKLFVPLVPSWYRHRRLLLSSLTARPRAVAPSSLRSSSPARIPDWEREEGKAPSQAPGLVPSLHRFWQSASPACIPDWEREEGKATSRAAGLVPSLRRLQQPSSPARIPDWKREEGKALSQAPGLVPSFRHDTMMLLSQPVLGGEDSSIRLASSSTTHSTTRPVLRAFMAENVANAILGVSLAM